MKDMAGTARLLLFALLVGAACRSNAAIRAAATPAAPDARLARVVREVALDVAELRRRNELAVGMAPLLVDVQKRRAILDTIREAADGRRRAAYSPHDGAGCAACAADALSGVSTRRSHEDPAEGECAHSTTTAM